DHFGSAVCGVGDINADGVPDVMVSAKNSAEGGTVHLLHLTLGGTVRSVKKVRNADTSPIPGVLADVGFGTSMALMKRNGHVSQVLIGSPLANVGHGQLWLLAVDSAGLVTSTHSVLDTVASATTTLPYLPGDGFGAAVALGADLDGNGSRDLWVAAPNATLTSMLRGNLWSIFTTPLTEDPRIRTVITTLTEDKTASGTAYALLEGFGANMPTLEWNTGEASGLHFQKIEEGSFQLSAERPGYSPLVKFYTMGFNAHWNFQNETELHKKNIKHDREGQQQLKAKANKRSALTKMPGSNTRSNRDAQMPSSGLVVLTNSVRTTGILNVACTSPVLEPSTAYSKETQAISVLHFPVMC
ncbi:MAG: FG-GAP repeat protein, partial [Flavobacteriales bacterium]|nr:FG-GAP repeat protein [Flavobacteriales bacterium]